MAEKTIQLQDGKERVAFDLLQVISSRDTEKDKTKDRAYWLKLMHECIKVVNGNLPPA